MKQLRRTAAVCLALGAIAFSALWPLLAPLSPSASALTAEVCSVNGSYHVDLGDKGSGQKNPSRLVPHCAFCTFGGDRLAFSKADLLGLVAPVEPFRIRLLETELPPLALLRLSPAQPRAPPAFS